MQTKTQLLLCLAISVMAAFAACKKETQKSKTELLTDGQWKITAFTLAPPIDFDGDGILDSDVYSTFEACEKDNYNLFHKDGTMEINEGASKCYAGDPQTETVNWSFVDNEKEIIIDGDRATIQELTSTRFRITLSLGSSIGELTFTK